MQGDVFVAVGSFTTLDILLPGQVEVVGIQGGNIHFSSSITRFFSLFSSSKGDYTGAG